MFVEADVEVTITDRTFTSTEEYDRKLWLQRAFRSNACYRISGYKAGAGKVFQATVAINARVLAEPDWKRVEGGQEPALYRWLVESMWQAKGTLRILNEPRLKAG